MNEIVAQIPKSVQLANIIRQKITVGELAHGERVLPVRKVAEKYSLSTQVVQSAFAILEKEGLIKTHVGRGTFVSFESGSIASKTVVLIIDGIGDSHNPIPALLPAAIQQKGLMSYVFDIGETYSKSSLSNIRQILETRPKAVVIDACSRLNFKILEFVEPGTKLIFLKRYERKTRDPQASYILENVIEGGKIACDYLLERGRRKIALVSFVGRPLWTSGLFASGVEKSLKTAGLKLYKYFDHEDMSEKEIVNELISNDFPDGVLCVRDFFYDCVDKAAKLKRLALYEDFDVVGYGNTPWAKIYGFPSLDPNYEKMVEEIQKCIESESSTSSLIKPILTFQSPNVSQKTKSVVS